MIIDYCYSSVIYLWLSNKNDCQINPLSYLPVDKLLSSEDGGGIFDDPPAMTESVMMPPDDEDDFDNLQSRE